MTYDESVPHRLLRTQTWFGSIIEEPLTEAGRIQPFTVRQAPIDREAETFIAPSPTLQPAERIEIYNQQYWYRLLDCLQQIFPLLVHLLGYERFNHTLAVPYLCLHRPTGWSLNDVGYRLSHWLKESYKGEDQELLCEAARVDWAFHYSFTAGHLPRVEEQLQEGEGVEVVMERKLALQPHLILLQGRYDLLAARDRLLEGAFIPQEAVQPQKRCAFVAVFRQNQHVRWRQLERGEARLLRLIASGKTLGAACASLEDGDATLREEASDRLAFWVQAWVLSGWLSLA